MDGKAAAEAAIAEAEAAGGRICAFFAESILSCGGQVRMVNERGVLRYLRQSCNGFCVCKLDVLRHVGAVLDILYGLATSPMSKLVQPWTL